MSPRNFLHEDVNKQQTKSGFLINGPRPTPLKIKQESHTIRKQQQHQQQSRIRKPIIIYLRSPKVIHTKPHEFMALVQRLTGHSSSKDEEKQKKTKKKTLEDGYDLNANELNNDYDVVHEKNKIVKSRSPMFNAPLNPYVADIPLFTPNTNDNFFSPQRLMSWSDMISWSPNKGASFSPGGLVEFVKRPPEY